MPRVYTAPRVYEPDPTAECFCSCGCGLTDVTSDGFSVIGFANDMLRMPLFPWQEWLLIHGLELNDDGTYRWRVVVAEIARQNGKTTVEVILALWHMYVLKSAVVIGTAQNLDNATKAWKQAVALAKADEELSELIPPDSPYLGHNKEFQIIHQDVDELGRDIERTSEYRITADARGFSGDLLLLDELRQQKNWDTWAELSNTMNARPMAQVWCFSNAPGPEGIVLRYLRALAHKELGWPDDDEDIQGAILGEIEDLPEFEDVPEIEFDLGFFEYSMAPGLPRNHPEGLMQANPSCNHTEVSPNCITYRALISGVRTSPAHIAEAEICCRETTLGVGGPFPEGTWEATAIQIKDGKPVGDIVAPAKTSKIVWCVEVSNRREQTYISSAGLTSGGTAVVGVREERPGTDWVKDYLVENRKTFAVLVVRSGSGAPVGALLKELQDARLPVVEWKGADIPAAHAQIIDRLRDKKIKHLPHGSLDMAATSAAEKQTTGGGFVVDDRKSPTDTAALYAVEGAVWGLGNADVKTPRVHGWDPEKVKQWEKQGLER
jgi:hypothetical protein